jgi:integrase
VKGLVKQARVLAKNVRAIEGVKSGSRQVNYRIKGERGLVLVVHPSGRKVWFVRYQVGRGKVRHQRWHEIGELGVANSLAKACSEARRIMARVADGEDPSRLELTTFGALFDAWLEQHAKKKIDTWKDEKRRYEMYLGGPPAAGALAGDAVPYRLKKGLALGPRVFAEIERKNVSAVRDEVLEKAGPIQSNRVVALFNRVANWAVEEGHAKFNPAARLRKLGEERRRERVLTLDELARIWGEIEREIVVDHSAGGLTEFDLPAAIAIRRALRVLCLTGQRRSEVIEMEKCELELDCAEPVWTIRAKRTKNRLPHRVPLTPMAASVIRQAIAASESSEYVFPSGRTEGPLRGDAVTKALQRICRRMDPKIEGLGPHDIRRTIGTTMRKLGISTDDRGHVFNHVSGAKSKVTSWNYDAGEHDHEKRAALEKWERELRRIVGLDSVKVVELRRA